MELYPLDFFISSLLGSLLISILVASIGILASFKAESIKQAYTRVTTAVITVTLLPSIILFAVAMLFPPSVTQSAANQLLHTNAFSIGIGLLILTILDLILIVLVLKLFKHTRLMSN